MVKKKVLIVISFSKSHLFQHILGCHWEDGNAKMSQWSDKALGEQSPCPPPTPPPPFSMFSFPDCLSNLHSLNCIFGIFPGFVSSQTE